MAVNFKGEPVKGGGRRKRGRYFVTLYHIA